MGNSIRWAFISGAFLGLSGVVAGAMGAHALKEVLSPGLMDAFETAVRFQMYHAIMLILLGIIGKSFPHRFIFPAIICMTVGTLLFSGSIYILTTSNINVGIITPIGGTVLIVGWGLLLVWALRYF